MAVFHLSENALYYLSIFRRYELSMISGKKDSLIYKEITTYLDSYNAEWRKYKELGSNAPQLILDVIADFEDAHGNYFVNDSKEL
jgi:hypothetical protein